jgi:hypothetical protein
MAKQWQEMNRGERQEARFARWLAGAGLEFKNPEAKARYQRRITRMKDAIQLKKTPDRVPILPWATFMPTELGGITPKEAMYDGDKLTGAMMKYLKEFDPDFYGSPCIIAHGPSLEVLDFKLYKWPGHNLPDQYVYQCMEDEYMTVKDYQHFIDDPTDWWLRVYLPRIAGALAPLQVLAPLYNTMELPPLALWLLTVGIPDVQEALKKLMEAGRRTFEFEGKIGAFDKEAQEMGFVQFTGGFSKAPYDFLADTLRGTRAMMGDLYRRPDLVLKAIERMTPIAIKTGLGGPEVTGNPIVFIPLHKGADGWMSDEQFRKFYWPSLKELCMALIEEGCVPFLFAEGGYNTRLQYLNELPKGHCLWLFDQTDMAKAKEIAGGNTCIAGNVPISKIMTGTVQDIRDVCKRLIDVAGKGGGYVMAMGCAADQGKADTIHAMIDFTKEYGVYK